MPIKDIHYQAISEIEDFLTAVFKGCLNKKIKTYFEISLLVLIVILLQWKLISNKIGLIFRQSVHIEIKLKKHTHIKNYSYLDIIILKLEQE